MSKQAVAILTGALVAALIGFGISFGLAAAGAEPLQATWVVAAVIGSFTTFAMLNVGGNKKVAVASDAERAAALALTPPPGQSFVIVYRDGFAGKANGADVRIDGRLVTQIKSPRFAAIPIAPGRHTMVVALAGSANAASVPAEVTFEVAAGEAAVFHATLAMKLTTSDVKLTRITDPAVARAKLAKLTMVGGLAQA